MPDDVFERCDEAASLMDWPKVDFATAEQWWRAMLTLVSHLGLRCRTVFRLRLSMIDWEGRRVAIPAKLMKARKKMVLPLPPKVYDHLAAIRSNRELLFEWPHSLEWFRKCFHKLQDLAGCKLTQRFGLHGLRRTAITRMWQTSPAAAQLLAGHGSPIITKQHYVNTEAIVRKAFEG